MSETMRSGTSHDHWQLPECPTQPPTLPMEMPRRLVENWATLTWGKDEALTEYARAALEDEAAGRTIDGYRAALLEAHQAFLAMRAVYIDSLLDAEMADFDHGKDEYELSDDYSLRRCVGMANDSEVYREYAGSFDEGCLPDLGWSYDEANDCGVWTDPEVTL